ncbi:hypothetical protein LUZ60_000188 [Juncus effusus]|nr:hypothetical protein LUZ60_000188 [Juncus effusus]
MAFISKTSLNPLTSGSAAAAGDGGRLLLRRGLALWSMNKDPALESSLARNRRWIINNQIKNLLLRSPTRTLPVQSLQKKYKTLDLQGSALNWLNKYPCCFDTFPDPTGESENLFFGFTKRMAELVEEEEVAIESSEPLMATRLAKLLMISRNRRLNVVKLNELKRNFGFPDDYLLRLLPNRPDLFRLVNHYGKKSTMEIELVNWDSQLATSAIESRSTESESEPHFTCSLPASWTKSHERLREFNERSNYISPYKNDLSDQDKRAVGILHELLSLTLWKKMSVRKLEHFKREFGLPEQLNRLLLRFPCIFYVSNRYKIYTVLLREAYNGSDLVEKDPLVIAKDKLGHLMQEGLHEYNQRRRVLNLENRRERGEIEVRKEREEINDVAALDRLEKREERRRFYKSLFGDG